MQTSRRQQAADPFVEEASVTRDRRDSESHVLITIPEAARRLSIGRSTAYELIAAGRLEVVHVGRSARVPVDALDNLVEDLRARRRQTSVTTQP